MRITTWNTQQAFPQISPADQWAWLEEHVAPDVAVLTEARVPDGGPPAGWEALWHPGGIGPRRPWGTVVTGRGVELAPVERVRVGRFRRRTIGIATQLPGAAVVADVTVKGERWATVVGLYGLTLDRDGNRCGNGSYWIPTLVRDLAPLFESDRSDRIIVAGDFNLCPADYRWGSLLPNLFDVATITSEDRVPLEGCTRCDAVPTTECGHLWTHRNGKSPNAAVQNIDYIFATDGLLAELERVSGGAADYPGIWDVSDHAPVVADFAR